MERYSSRRKLTAGQRDGILFLMALILVVLFYRNFPKKEVELNAPVLDDEMRCQIELLDNLRRERQMKSRVVIYPFNPTFLNDYRGYILGLPPVAVDRISAFRESGNWINSLEQFQMVTQLSDSVMERIAPYLELPEFLQNSGKPRQVVKETSLIGDLNTATQEDFIQIRGIGSVKSKQIKTFRERIGGFAHMHELYAIYGLDAELIKRIKSRFTLDQPRSVDLIRVNQASASDLATIPGIGYEVARSIWLERRKIGGFKNWSELRSIPEIGLREFALIEVYLSLE
ncbi:helix-hairpin-helix domain-containing protein [Aureitalea marina]|uniref:Competence protein ComEA n=1 Tax=Aureitalea marina TaxID=930804 RepID=A0A2S7KQC0_9FLAO|nr:helix-hairpin-helix domain-containing protein [Aureitalea marina]PQB04829.1 hypothetical protein BST85_07915 [Aureitalea marina]